jgi:hypothetical protein
LLLCASTALALFLADGLHRLWRWKNGLPTSPEWTHQALLNALETTRRFTPRGPETNARPAQMSEALLTPYSGGELYHDTGGVLKYWREEAAPENFEILVMGGSVAASLGEFLKATATQLFEGADLGGKKLVVLNYAHASYKQPQQAGRLMFLFALGHRPEVVLEVDGFNEVALGLENGKSAVHPIYPSAPTWDALFQTYGVDPARYTSVAGRMLVHRERALEIVASAEGRGFFWSSLLSAWTERAVHAEQNQFVALQQELQSLPGLATGRPDRQRTGPDYDAADDAPLAMCVNAWFEGSLSMKAMCDARGVRYVHMLQPTLYDPDSKPVHERERALAPPSPFWIEGARRGYPLLRAKAPELTAAGVRFLDASRVFAEHPEPVYLDACHVLRDGEAYWFRRMRPQILAALFGP